MYLGFKKFNHIRYLCLLESYRATDKTYPQKRVIQRFFKEELISPELKTLLADKDWKASAAERMQNLSEGERIALFEQEVSGGAVTITPPPATEVITNFNKMPLLHYGHLLFKHTWDYSLGLRNKLNYMQKKLSKVQSWDLTDLLFYLSVRKILNPSSYYDAHADKADYLYCPWEEIKQDNFYRGLDFMAEHGEELMAYAVRHHQETEKREIKVAFFDCTNTWFETPYDDVTWAIIRFRREMQNILEKQGASEEQITEYFESEQFDKDLQVRLNLSEDDILRMRGKSKEGRYNQPLVTVALAIDQTGFPIDCRVFVGNLHELKTIEPMLTSLKEKYSVTDVYFTADRGLNSTGSLSEIKQQGLGFVVAQKVLRQSKEHKAEMLDLNGYQRYTIEGDNFISSDEPVEQNCLRFKICNYTRKSWIVIPNGGLTPKGHPRRSRETINCKIIYTYSPERYKRDMAELENEKQRAMRAVHNGETMGNPYKTGWRSLVETAKEQAEGADKAMYVAKGLKEDVIKEREDAAGYYAVVFDHPDDCSPEHKLSDLQILNTYHKLVRIEDCFRIMKSHFSLRPVYVWKKPHIIGHCYLCVLALMLLKDLQNKLEATGVRLSVRRICDVVSQATVGLSGDGNYKNLKFINLGIENKIYHPENTGKDRRQADINDLDDTMDIAGKNVALRSVTPDDLDLIISATGLKPLKLINTMGDIKCCLSLQPVPNNKMVSAIHMEYLAAAAAAQEISAK